jgi:hypothetical protein
MPRAVEDLTGMEFGNGMVKVISRADNGNTRHAKWLCQCECGKIFVEYALNLKAGRRNSCGCLSKRKPTDSISLHRLNRSGDDPWHNLANAIVAVAADDYRSALRNEDEGLLKSLELFFHSEWYRILTDVDADRLLGMLRRERVFRQVLGV